MTQRLSEVPIGSWVWFREPGKRVELGRREEWICAGTHGPCVLLSADWHQVHVPADAIVVVAQHPGDSALERLLVNRELASRILTADSIQEASR